METHKHEHGNHQGGETAPPLIVSPLESFLRQYHKLGAHSGLTTISLVANLLCLCAAYSAPLRPREPRACPSVWTRKKRPEKGAQTRRGESASRKTILLQVRCSRRPVRVRSCTSLSLPSRIKGLPPPKKHGGGRNSQPTGEPGRSGSLTLSEQPGVALNDSSARRFTHSFCCPPHLKCPRRTSMLKEHSPLVLEARIWFWGQERSQPGRQ